MIYDTLPLIQLDCYVKAPSEYEFARFSAKTRRSLGVYQCNENKIEFRPVAAVISLFPVSDPHGGKVLVGGGVFGGYYAGGGGGWIQVVVTYVGKFLRVVETSVPSSC